MGENSRQACGQTNGTNTKGGGTGGVAAAEVARLRKENDQHRQQLPSATGVGQQRTLGGRAASGGDPRIIVALAKKCNCNEQWRVDIDTAVKVQANKAQATKPATAAALVSEV